MKITSLPWLLVPGMGQIRGGAPGLGVLLFTLFVLALNGLLLNALLCPHEEYTLPLGIAAGALWLFSAVDGLRRLAKGRHETR
jgi:apolipoprotein N-acyltransferase